MVHIRQRTVDRVRVFGLLGGYLGSFLVWMLSGFSQGGAVPAAYIALVGMGVGAWAFWYDGKLSEYLPGFLVQAMVPVGVLAAAYLPGRQWAWVLLGLWVSSSVVPVVIRYVRVRRIDPLQFLAALIVVNMFQGQRIRVNKKPMVVLGALEALATAAFLVTAGRGYPVSTFVTWLVIALVLKVAGLVVGFILVRRARYSY